jgi:hypothetical protein
MEEGPEEGMNDHEDEGPTFYGAPIKVDPNVPMGEAFMMPATSVRKVAGMIPVSRDVLEDAGWVRNEFTLMAEAPARAWVELIQREMNRALRRIVAPWEFADQPATFTPDLFPRFDAAVASVAGRARRARERVGGWLLQAAYAVGADEPDRDDW